MIPSTPTEPPPKSIPIVPPIEDLSRTPAATSSDVRWWKFQRRAAPWLFISPFLILFAIFFLYPLITSFLLSLYKTAGPQTRVFVGLGNYRNLLTRDITFLLVTLNTAAFAVAFLLVHIPISLGLAILLNRRDIRFRNVFRFSFFSSYLVGQVFVAIVFSQLLGDRGLVNRFVDLVFHPSQPIHWLTSPSLAMVSVLIADLWLSIGYGMVYFLAALQAVDHELYDAAQVDGAGKWTCFRHVTLPGIRPVLAYVILIDTIGAFQLFELPFVLFVGSGPGGRATTLVMYLFFQGWDGANLGYASAIGWMLVLILLLVALAQFKLIGAKSETEAA